MTYKLPFLSDEHHFAIANVAARAAQLDHHIEFAIQVLMDEQANAAKHLLKNMNSDRLVGYLEGLLLDRFPDQSSMIEDRFKKIVEARRGRNELLHWLWGTTEEPGTMKIARIRPYHEDREASRTTSDIMALAAEMLNATLALNTWTTRHQEERRNALLGRLGGLAPLPHWASPETPDRTDTPEQPAPQQETSRE